MVDIRLRPREWSRRAGRQAYRLGRRLRRTRPGQAAYEAVRSGLGRWRRSLQLRIVAITLLTSGLLVASFGFIVAERITDGLVDAKLHSALGRLEYGRRDAQQQLSVLAGPGDPDLAKTIEALPNKLGDVPGQSDSVEVVLASSAKDIPIDSASWPSEHAIRYVPEELRRLVAGSQVTAHQFTLANPDGRGMRPYLVVGTPVQLESGSLELYYLFPLDDEVA